jgi:transcriptional regulator with XRE-family HTH domain
MERVGGGIVTFAATLKGYREKVGLSQSRLALRTGIDHSYVSKLESGRQGPSRAMTKQFAEAMSLTPSEADELMASAGYLVDVDALAVSLSAKVLNNAMVDQGYREHVRDMVHRLIEDAGRFPVKASRVVRMDQEAA